MKKIHLMMVLAGFFLFQTMTFADENVRNQEAVATMDEIIVTATKTKELRKDVPNSVILIDDLDIKDSPATSFGDLLGGEPGIDWRTRGDYGGAEQEIHIRGMSADGTQIVVNGVTINSPSLGIADAGKIPMNNIERVEIVKGSGSVLYGSGAMSGIVNIITKSPKRDQTDLKINAGYGSENAYQISAEQGMFVFGDLGYYITANSSGTDGFRDNADYKQSDVSLKLVLDKGENLNISLYGDYIDREGGRPGVEPPTGTSLFTVRGIPVYNSESSSLLNELKEKDKHLVFKIKSKPLDWIGFNFQTDYTDMESNNYSRYYSSFTPGNLPGSETEVINKIWGVEGNVEINPFKGGTLLTGIQYKKYDWENTSTTLDGFGNESSQLMGKNDLYTTGIFSEAQYRPNKYIKGIIGVRQEDHSTFGTKVLPRYGLIITPVETTTLKFNTGRHFKAPTPNDLFWPLEDWGWGMGAEGNPNLKPETGWHSDAGIEQTFADKKIFIFLTYFKWDIKDKISWVPDSNFFYRPDNLSIYEASGWEVGTKIGPFNNMTLSLDYTYTDATEQKQGGVQRKARYTANNFFKTSLTYWFDFGLDLTGIIRYTGERPAVYALDTDTAPQAVLSSYWMLDLKANQQIGENWALSCRINNLFDKDYTTYSENFYDQFGTQTLSKYPGAGRSIFLSLNYQF
ncbi:MAG: TonB-dependent receptor [Desulfobacula sp.]|uniref:TonB-dependent receptor plug domain-containing protein n=1 Tax=Desulfobacula sp. TaxID=2593537 RepID=UPI0025C36E8A|nr:TonB-dependent receptor [Desulfobacula sp.]MCD4719511.1 TonB-dependent receptor [Desulfobacula sp.]